MRRPLLLPALLLAAAAPGCEAGDDTALLAAREPVVVVLARHAERAEDGSDDPPISEVGRARAGELAHVLADAGITRIHTTDYRRTRETGAPLVERTGLEAEVYDPRDLAGFAARLREAPGRHLVLGHSNTTPDLVAALGGVPGEAIGEMEYDRLYVVVIPAVGPVTTTLLRFGVASAASERAESAMTGG